MTDTKQVPLDSIKIGARHRKDMGDLDALAKSIREVGLLQPIGVTKNYELIFGARRIAALRKLQQTTVLCRVLNMGSILRGEFDENEHRKDFTVSERVDIGRAIEEALGNRQGERTDRENADETELRANLPEVEPGQRTTEVAAASAGMSRRQYEKAKAVVETAEPEVVAAVDAGQVSIHDAAEAAKATPPKQRAAAKKVTSGKAKTLKEALGESKKEPKKKGPFDKLLKSLETAAAEGKHIETDKGGPTNRSKATLTKIDAAYQEAKEWKKALR